MDRKQKYIAKNLRIPKLYHTFAPHLRANAREFRGKEVWVSG